MKMHNQTSKIQNHIMVHLEDQVGYITFNNSEKHNALTQSAWQAIPYCVEQIIEQKARAIIIRGIGQSFCAGADISEFDQVRKNVETAQIYEQSNILAFQALRESPIPTIAQIKGYCLGGGFGIACACDLRLSDESAQFSVPAAKLGLGYPVEAMADIVHAIGTQNAKLMLFTARKFTARQMHDFGFLHQITAQEDLAQTCQNLALETARLAPLTHHATKAAIKAVHLGGDKTALKAAISISNTTFTSADYKEGRQAFKERRSADFKGH